MADHCEKFSGPSRSNMMRKMRCRASERQVEQRGRRPFGAMRPFGPASNLCEPQIGHAAVEMEASALAFMLGTASSERQAPCGRRHRSEEHTSELQSQSNLVCRLLLEKKKKA